VSRENNGGPRSIKITGWSLSAAFAAIILAFALANAITMMAAQRRESETRAIIQNTLTSIELVARLGRDLAEQRRLVDAHVYEKEAVDMGRLEAEIAQIDVDLDTTERAYEPWVMFPEERPTWEKLRAKIAGLHGPMERVLELSRQNRDFEAFTEAAPLQAQFADIAKSAALLIDLNQVEGERAIVRIQAGQRIAFRSFLLLTLTGIALAITVAVSVTRVLKRREEQIARMTQRLENRNRELDAFAGRVAHDLRGPLTALSYAGERLAKSGPDERVTAAVRRGVSRMDALIGDLLALSRMEAQPPGVCDPCKVAAAIVEDWEPPVEQDGGVLDVNVEPAAAQGSESLIRQALANLVDNAVKYRRADVPPRIAIRGTVTPRKTYELRVSDNGIGLLKDDASRVFEPFHRAARSSSKPGTGLGLSIVKRIIEACGGHVSLVSVIDRGTTFTIELPLAEPPAASTPDAPAASAPPPWER
jgi:signal transduction histidine kinase